MSPTWGLDPCFVISKILECGVFTWISHILNLFTQKAKAFFSFLFRQEERSLLDWFSVLHSDQKIESLPMSHHAPTLFILRSKKVLMIGKKTFH